MADKEREALPSEAIISAMADTWADRTGIVEKLKSVPSNLPTEEMRQRHDALVLRHTKLSYEEGIAAGWQAARDHYAPKLSEKEAVSVIAPMVCREGAKWEWNLTSEHFKKRWFDVLKEALRAAGIRFAEET